MKYIVEVMQRPLGNTQGYTSALAQTFGIPLDKAESLIARLPGKVSKPVNAQLAKDIADRFQSVGLDTVVRPTEGIEEGLELPGSDVELEETLDADFSAIEFDDLPLPIEDTGYDTMLGVNPDDVALEALELDDSPEAFDDVSPYEIGLSPAADALLSQTGSQSVAGKPSVDSAPQRRGSILRKLLSIAILPTLLTIIGALSVIWFVVRPVLYDQLLDAARNPAIAAAASLSGQLGDVDPANADELLDTILLVTESFPQDSLSFIVATDAQGAPLATSFEQENRDLEALIRAQALRAVQGKETNSDAAQRQTASGERFEIVAQPIRRGEQTVGTVVVGVTDRAVTGQVNRILLTTLLFSLVPLALAILFAVTRARSLSKNIVRLTQRADEISRGDLSHPVESLNSRDELEDLGQALERLRVSMQEALARLRRRRT